MKYTELSALEMQQIAAGEVSTWGMLGMAKGLLDRLAEGYQTVPPGYGEPFI